MSLDSRDIRVFTSNHVCRCKECGLGYMRLTHVPTGIKVELQDHDFKYRRSYSKLLKLLEEKVKAWYKREEEKNYLEEPKYAEKERKT